VRPDQLEADALKAAKRTLRQQSAAARSAAVGKLAPDAAGERVGELVLAAVPLPVEGVVSGYWPVGDELDIRPLLMRLHGAGHRIGLPVVTARGEPLRFRCWEPGAPMMAAAYGIQIPGAAAPEVVPAVVLAPMLAFDRAGYRLGYGGGFYDRTLAGLRMAGRVMAVGVAYAAQEVAAVPREATDQRLDWIVTEDEAIRMK
jgi:5-formyltetrahydrofolate cyclo-ligase